MVNKRFAKNPLLYIEQPTINTPKAPMQDHYYTPQENHQTAERTKKKIVRKQTRPLKRINFSEEEDILEEKVEEVVQEEDTGKDSSSNKFKDMTLSEKINYFVDRPNHAPKIRCEIKTTDKKFQGVVLGKEDDDVLMRVGRRTSSSKIPFSEIIGIRMLGF